MMDELPARAIARFFGPVAYIDPTADPLMYDAQNLVLKIQAAYNLAPHRNVGVVGTTLPEPVGERGGKLSGGQRQRVACFRLHHHHFCWQ